MRMTNQETAFNDIGLVDLTISTPMGQLVAGNMGPNDVVITATPGNNGDVMNIFEGATGQLLANKSYKVKNWTVQVRFLRHSLDYCRGTWLIQEILDGHITTVGVKFVNKNFGGGKDDSSRNEILESSQAFLVNFEGLEAGPGASGDFTMTFRLSDAVFTSGEYTQFGSEYKPWDIPSQKVTSDGSNTLTYGGVDSYTQGGGSGSGE